MRSYMEADYEGFSIREYTRHIRSVEVRKCWPFSGDITGDVIHSLLPPLTVAKFRWWSHELASLLQKSPVTPDDDSDPASRRKAVKETSRPCKKRSIDVIFAAAPQIQLARREGEGEDSDVFIGWKRRKTKDLVVQKKIKSKKLNDFANKVYNCKEQSRENVEDGKCSLGIKKRSYTERNIISLELCCSQMNLLSLCSAEDQSSKKTKVISNDQTSDNMQIESRQLNKFQAVVSERRLSHAQAKPGLSYFPTPHLSLERIKDALELENKGHVAQPIQSFISTSSESPYRSCSSSLSQPASADMHCGTLLNHSPFDPLLVEWMQKSVLHRQRLVEEVISGFPLNLQGELVEANGESRRSFERSGLGTGSSGSASAENVLLLSNFVDLSSGKKHSTEPALSKDVHNEKRRKYFPARLGLDETFIEKAFFVSDTNDGECGQTVHSPVSEVNLKSHTINHPKQDALTQNLNSRNMAANRDGLCLRNTQSTMRLMGKDVSVGTSYSDMVRRGERIIAPDASIDYSFLSRYTNQSCWLWRSTTLGISENHSVTSVDKNWNSNVLCNTSKDPFPMFWEPHVGFAPQARTAVVPDSDSPPTILYPCGSLLSSPLTDTDLTLHESGLGQQLNSVTFSQQQPHFSHTPETIGLPSDYSNVGVGLLPDPREPSFGLPFSCTDSTRQSQPHWPLSSFESSRSAEQLASLYESNQLVVADQFRLSDIY